MLFEPNHEVLSLLGLNVEEAVVSASEKGDVWVPIENYQGVPAHLEAGVQLGTVRISVCCRPLPFPPCGVENPSPCPEDVSPENVSPDSAMAAVRAIEYTPKRIDKLTEELNLPNDRLSPSENADLKLLSSNFQTCLL